MKSRLVLPVPKNTMSISRLPDGSYVRTWWDEDSGLAGHQLWSSAGKFVRTIKQFVGMSLAASPTRQDVAFTSKNMLHIHHLSSGSQVEVEGYFRASAYFGSLVWSPDGEQIAIGGINPDSGYPEDDDWQLNVVTRTGENVRTIGSAERISHISWHTDGQRIAYDDEKTTYLVDATDKQYRPLDLTVKYSYRPTGQGAAYILLKRRPQLVFQAEDADDFKVIAFFDSPSRDDLPHNLWWSPDGRFLLFNGSVDHHAGWYVYDAQQTVLYRIFVDTDGYYTSPCWHHDSKEITFLTQNGIEVFTFPLAVL